MSGTGILVTMVIALSAGHTAAAQVRVITGPTPIPAGNARAPRDISVVNERLAFALAVGSPVPYGLPRGALVDLAPVVHGRIGRDRVVFADFIPNNWSAWPNTYQRVDVLERGPQQARIRAVRDWGKVTITTLYTLAAGSDRVAISATMKNEGAEPLPDLLSGLTLWPSSGFLFPVPGLAGTTEGRADGALSARVVAYDADWSVTLHAPYLDHVGSGSRDLFQLHTLAPHASRTFEGWLQVGPRGDLAPVVAAEIERRHLPAGLVHGTVTTGAGQPLAQPVVVVELDGKPYAWTLGHDGSYALQLPAGSYALYATGRGYSNSRVAPVSVVAGGDEARDFRDLEPPGRVEFNITETARGTPLDARITISEGMKPLVEFLGRKTFFTDLEHPGHALVAIAPGAYHFNVTSGGGFLAPGADLSLTVEPGKVAHGAVRVTRLFDPPARGWYAADLHHHADQAEAVTPPEELARSELAAGLDVLFVSDHDSMANHAALSAIAAHRGVPFLPGIELSPSWGHFNAYPIRPGAHLAIDTGTATVDAVIAEARREGAAVVQVNHPYIPFGYFTSLGRGVAPGGFSPAFDLVEINAQAPQDDDKVLAKLWEFWNQGRHYYLSAGSDTHDVWNEESGRVRVFAHVAGRLTPESFVSALKDGHAYVSHGPLVFPLQPPGAIIVRAAAPVTLSFDLASVAGLSKAELIGGGKVLEERSFSAAPLQAHVEFVREAASAGPRWYALVVEDSQGRRAYTDPYWVVSDGAPSSPADAATKK